MTAAAGTAAASAPRPRRRRRWWWLAALPVLLFLWCGCVSIVTPPANPRDPVTVLVIADQLHRGLCLPDDRGGVIEFGFGDWSWYALGNDSWYHVFATVLWPTAGTLSRREFPGRATAADLQAVLPHAGFEAIVVGGAEMRDLRARLEGQFAAGAAAAIWSDAYRMRFIPCDRSYWFGANCADQVADWLRELGCRVTWVPIRTGLRAVTPP